MKNTLQVTETATVSMTSREIAELTGKRHDNVMRTIDTLVENCTISHPQIEDGIKGANGVVERLYKLNKRDSIVVVARLSPEFTAAVVDRWQELETQLHQLESEKVKDLERRNLQLIHDLSDNISHIASSMNAIKAAENEVKAMKARMSDYIAERVIDLRELAMEMRVAKQVGFSEDLVAVVTAMLKDLKGIANPKNEELQSWSMVSKQGLDRYAQERVAALQRQAKIQIPNRNK